MKYETKEGQSKSKFHAEMFIVIARCVTPTVKRSRGDNAVPSSGTINKKGKIHKHTVEVC